MLTYSAISRGDAAAAWRLLVEPGQWHRWAPHIRGARGLGTPEVQVGCSGLALVGLWLPLPATIVAKEPGRSWEWQVGPVRMRHLVKPRAERCEIVVTLDAPAPLEAALRLTYGPVMTLTIRNLARIAAGEVPVSG